MDLKQKSSLTLIRAIIWGIGGGFYGIVYHGFVQHLHQNGEQTWHVVAAAALAGAVVSALYSAKRIAIVGAIAGMSASLGYLIAAPQSATAYAMLAAAASTGFLVGIPVSRIYERRRGALFIVGTGAIAGCAAGLAGVGIRAVYPSLDQVEFLTFLMAPLTGVLFIWAAIQLFHRYAIFLPHWLSVSLVSAVIAGVVGASFWALSAPISEFVSAQTRAAVQAMFVQSPHAALGGALGCAIAAIILEWFDVPWVHRIAVRRSGESRQGY